MTLVIGIASGIIWPYAEFNIQHQNQINDLRKQVINAQEKMLGVANDTIEAQRIKDDNIRESKLVILEKRADTIEIEFDQWEGQLAVIEGRQPKKLIRDFLPPTAPTAVVR